VFNICSFLFFSKHHTATPTSGGSGGSSSSSSISSSSVDDESGAGDAGGFEQDDEELDEPDDVFEPEDAEEAHRKRLEAELPGPLTTPEEFELFLKLHTKMVYPNGKQDKPLPVDFNMLLAQFNDAVFEKTMDDPSLHDVLKMKTKPLLVVAYNRMTTSAHNKKIIGDQLQKIIELQQFLKSDKAFLFPGVISVPSDAEDDDEEMEEQDGAVVGAEEQQEEEDNTMDLEDEEQEKRKRSVIEDWNWQPTASTGLRKLQQRRNILNTVLWCPKCYEICRVSSGSKGHKFINGHTKKSNRGEQAYPNCDTKGKVTRADVSTWNNKFRFVRRMTSINKLIEAKKNKKKKKK